MKWQVIKNRARRGLLYSAYLAITLLLASFVALQIPAVQESLTSRYLREFQRTTGFNVSAGSLYLTWYDRLVVHDLVVEDPEGNKMITAETLTVNFALRTLFGGSAFNLDGATVDSASVYVANIQESDTSRDLNINVFVDRVNRMSAGAGGKSPLVNIGEVSLDRSQFIYNDNDSDSIRRGFDYYHFAVSLDAGSLTQFKVIGDTIQFQVNSLLAVNHATGLDVKNLRTFFRISQTGLEFTDLHLKAGNSTINDSVVFQFKSQRDLRDFNNKVSISMRLNDTVLDPHDLDLFVPGAKAVGKPIRLSGILSGRVKRLSYKKMRVQFGRTLLSGSLELDGLPALDETFIKLALSHGTIDIRDLQFAFPQAVFRRLEPLTQFQLDGTFRGFFNDFVVDADVYAPLGHIKSNVNFKVDEKDFDNSQYDGKVSVDDFRLGEYLGDTTLFQLASLDGAVHGKGLTLAAADLLLVGNVHSIGIRGYNYSQIKTDARFSSKFFNGDLTINDPNLKFTAEGSVDLRKGNAEIRLRATLDTAFVDKLGITSQPLFVHSYIDVDSRGLHIDSLFGDALLRDTRIVYNNKSLSLDSIHVFSKLEEGERSFTVRSSIFDASLKGNFYNSTLFGDVGQFYDEFMLSVRNDQKAIDNYYSAKRHNNQSYEANLNMVLHDIQPISDLTNIDLAITDSTVVEGRFANGLTSIFQLFTYVDTLTYAGKMLVGNEFEFTGSKLRDSATVLSMITLRSAQQHFSTAIETTDLLLEGIWNRNHIDVGLDLDQPRLNNEMRVRAEVDFLTDITRLRILPSYINVLTKEWQVDPRNMILFKGKEVQVSQLELHHDSTSVLLDGGISVDPETALVLTVTRLNLDLLDNFSTEHFSGDANGTVSVHNAYGRREFQNDIHIKGFTVNDFLIGDITGINKWNPETTKFDIELAIDRLEERTVDIEGTYDPAVTGSPLDVRAEFVDMRLRIIGPLLRGIFSEIDGRLTGTYAINGNFGSPEVRGVGTITDGQIKIDYLGTLYRFNGSLGITPTQFVFEDWAVKDIMGNKGTLSGYVAHKNFGKFTINLDGQFANFQVLNTTFRDNDWFYGQGFATGDLNIFGPSSNLKISATARTDANTRLFIPVSGSSEVTKKEFINFKNFTDSLAYEVINTEGRRRELSGVALDLNLQVTPAAYAEIIFDIKAGDIIRGRGNGDLLIQMDTKGEFNMFGGIQFTEGAYNFTLYDIINKEFSIKPGSHLTWHGDPYQGIMDITASYRQLASLAPIYDKDPDLQAEPAIKRKYPLEVLLKLDGPMLSPNINFDLVANDLPNSVPVEGRGPVRLSFDFSAFKSRLDEQELKRQVFSLVILRRLSPLDAFSTSGSLANSVSELLSNQLSYWLGQVDQNLEIDLDLGAMDAEAFNTFQLRMSYTFLNGRLRVTRDGTFSNQSEQQQNVAAILGDWTVDYLLTPDGKFRVKMYNRSNFNAVSNSIGAQGSMTTGVSLMHTQNFNEIKDLLGGARDKRRRELQDAEEAGERDGGN